MRGRSPADLTGCGRAAPDPPGPLRLPGGPRAGLEPAAPRVRLRGEQRVADHAARRAVLRAGHAGRAARSSSPSSGPKPRPTSARRPSTTRSTGASTTCSSLGVPAWRRLERWMAKAYGWVERTPQPALQPGVRSRVGDDRLLASPAGPSAARGTSSTAPNRSRVALPVAPGRGGRAQVGRVRRVEGGRRDPPPLRAGRHHLVGAARRVHLARHDGDAAATRTGWPAPTSHARLAVSAVSLAFTDPARPRGVGPQAPPPEPVRRPDHAVDAGCGPTTRPPRRSRSGRPGASTSAHRAGSTPAGPARSAPAARRRRSGRPCRARSSSGCP